MEDRYYMVRDIKSCSIYREDFKTPVVVFDLMYSLPDNKKEEVKVLADAILKIYNERMSYE